MRHLAFTLVELLVVMAILATLMGMLMPIVTLAKRSSERTATTAVMHKVDTAARLFRNEIGAYPWQKAYADIDGGETWTNRLAYQLGQDIDTSASGDLSDVQKDAADAAAKYAYECTVNTSTGAITEPAVSTFAFSRAYIQRAWSGTTDMSDSLSSTNQSLMYGSNSLAATAAVLNRMAAELARVEVFSGNPWVKGLRVDDVIRPDGVVVKAGQDNTATQLITNTASTPASKDKPGWAADYLLGELEARFRSNEAILDAWGMPLLFVSQNHEGARFSRTYMFRSVVYSANLRKYGLHRRGRTLLAAVDPITNTALAASPPYLPDPANLRNSDRRFYAAPGYEVDIELWSAGPDRLFGWMRDDPRNRDNVSLSPYDRALP